MNIDITTLTPEQLASITKQLKAVKAETKTNREAWQAEVDRMLQPEEGLFVHTTADIWLSLHLAKLEPLDPRETHDKDERDRVLKKIQARKQKLQKLGKDVGYAPTEKAVGKLSVDQLIAKLIQAKTDGELEERHLQTLRTF